MNRLLLLTDTPGTGCWNMAVDEALLLGKSLVFSRSHHGSFESFPCRLTEWRGELAGLGRPTMRR